MKISNHFNKDNPHHAYLIEGTREEVVPEVLAFVEGLGVSIVGNPDFYNITLDSFKIEDARNLKSLTNEMSIESGGKRVFIVSANSFIFEAQNTMMKMFEEPILNTHFFIIVPDTDVLLKTLLSRFYLIRGDTNLKEEMKKAEVFISMSARNRIDFIKEMLAEDDEDGEENISLNSTRARAIKFLNAVEATLHKKLVNVPVSSFNQIFKVREFLRMPGSSTKSLMESVALVIPVL